MSKTIELYKVRQGEIFTLDGVDFVKLADDQWAVFALTRDVVLENVPFDETGKKRKDHNNFARSSIEQVMEHWLRTEHRKIFERSLPTNIDLATMDGMTDYGCQAAIVRALTIDEYRKYRRFIPMTDAPYWLATGYSTNSSPNSNASIAYYVFTDGTLGVKRVSDVGFAARPALYITPATIVSVEDGGEETCIANFTDTELIEELYKRKKKIEEEKQ